MTPVWMAEELGLFKKYNLEAQLIYIPSSATSVQALLGGSVDVNTPGSSGVVIAAARGVQVVAVAASTRRAPFTLFTQPEITKPEDLKGKVTGVTRFNSTTHMMTVLILRKLHLENFVSVRQMRDVPRHAQRSVTRSFLHARPDTLERVLRAYVEGLAAFLGQKERAKNILAKYMRRSQPEFLEETFDTASKYLEPIPRVDRRIVPVILDFAGIKDVNPHEVAARVIDNSVLEKLQRKKVFDNLFGKKK